MFYEHQHALILSICQIENTKWSIHIVCSWINHVDSSITVECITFTHKNIHFSSILFVCLGIFSIHIHTSSLSILQSIYHIFYNIWPIQIFTNRWCNIHSLRSIEARWFHIEWPIEPNILYINESGYIRTQKKIK